MKSLVLRLLYLQVCCKFWGLFVCSGHEKIGKRQHGTHRSRRGPVLGGADRKGTDQFQSLSPPNSSSVSESPVPCERFRCGSEFGLGTGSPRVRSGHPKGCP